MGEENEKKRGGKKRKNKTVEESSKLGVHRHGCAWDVRFSTGSRTWHIDQRE